MIILDTNIISEVMRPAPEPKVMAWLRKQPLNTLAITAVTLAEIRYSLGRLPAGQRRRNLEERFRAFIVRGFDGRIVAFDAVAALVSSLINLKYDPSTTSQADLHPVSPSSKDVFDGFGMFEMKDTPASGRGGIRFFGNCLRW